MAAAGDNQQTWVPYVPTRDCSMGFCSIYCPQWCYVIFPPPPPSEFSDDGSGVTFSPLVIAIIGVLAGALLLICYYTVVSKYCGGFRSVRRWLNPPGAAGNSLDLPGGRPRRSEAGWPQDSPANGVDEALIRKIAVHKYRRGDGVVQSADCSVCLSEFREEESLRLLPKCGHAFHLQCIDTWLRSHSNCPLCRASINIPLHPPPPPPPQPPVAATAERVVLEAPGSDEMAIVVEERVQEEERRELGKHAPQITAEQSRHSKVDIREDDDEEEEEENDRRPIRRSFSTENASNQDKVSIADVLQMRTEDEASSAAAAGTSTSAHGNDGRRNRAPHGAASRSLPSGRFC
ncbi:E3 ubiquitin-protein ligase Os04g0590900-like [Curcuma longa]|uniref:E3 ubiquitin-protein ligase Os04g0590900-like n=1 Tax=Curcuma longa TaxID=136217 RepID=UPI003D9EF42E